MGDIIAWVYFFKLRVCRQNRVSKCLGLLCAGPIVSSFGANPYYPTVGRLSIRVPLCSKISPMTYLTLRGSDGRVSDEAACSTALFPASGSICLTSLLRGARDTLLVETVFLCLFSSRAVVWDIAEVFNGPLFLGWTFCNGFWAILSAFKLSPEGTWTKTYLPKP